MIEHRIGVSRRSARRPHGEQGRHPAGAAVLPDARARRAADAAGRAGLRAAAAARRHDPPAGRRPDLDAASWSRPSTGPTSDGALLYLHGGAFLMGGCATHRRIVERLALRTGMAVLSVDYRKLPKRPAPRQHRGLRGRLPVAAAHTATAPPDRASPATPPGATSRSPSRCGSATTGPARPPASSRMSPWLDFDHMTKVSHHNARRDAYIPIRRLRRVGRMVVGAHPELHHSPVNADLPRPAAGADHLRGGGGAARRRRADGRPARGAGVRCTLQIWEGQIHAFPVLADLTPESRAAVERGGRRSSRRRSPPPAYSKRGSAGLPDAVGVA